MPRPCKYRRIGFIPKVTRFVPEDAPEKLKEDVTISRDEMEAVRLADFEGLYQEDASREMGISRQTFGRILDSAHRKIGEALVKGKPITIEGGKVEMREMRKFVCYECSHKWEVPYGTGRPHCCPECESGNIHRAPEDRGYSRCGGGGYGRRRRNRCGW